MEKFIAELPKAELHVHIEGTLEPEMMFELASRNDYDLPFADVASVKAAYQFSDLQSFLDIYYKGAAVLQTPQDFYDLMRAYLDKAAEDGVRRAEIFFDPQTHTERDIGFPVFMQGFREAMADASSSHGMSTDLILCFLRHLGGEDALDTIRAAEDHLDGVIAVGLDSSEVGYPPEEYTAAYGHARTLGLDAVAHAGEEGPPEYVWAALDVLGVSRVDHGVRSLEDPELVQRLVADQVPLTVCPLSNVALKVVDDIHEHPLREMKATGLLVSINSDDPSYFGGYVGENYRAVSDAFDWGERELADLAANSIRSSFLDEDAKSSLLDEIESLVGDQS